MADGRTDQIVGQLVNEANHKQGLPLPRCQAASSANSERNRQPHHQGGHIKLRPPRPMDEILAVNRRSRILRVAASTTPSRKMKAERRRRVKPGDTVGGIFEVIAHNISRRPGAACAMDEKLDGRLAQAVVMSIQSRQRRRDWRRSLLPLEIHGARSETKYPMKRPPTASTAAPNRAGGPRRRHHQRGGKTLIVAAT